jgi:phosphate/sulfate permease
MRAPFWAGLLLGLLVGAGLMLTGPRVVERLARGWAPAVDLHPAVAVQHRTVRLTNTDSFAWQQVQLVLNARAPGDGYTLHLAHLAAGALVEVALTRFTAHEGASFDPRTAKAFRLSLEADTPHGRGVWSGRID